MTTTAAATPEPAVTTTDDSQIGLRQLLSGVATAKAELAQYQQDLEKLCGSGLESESCWVALRYSKTVGTDITGNLKWVSQPPAEVVDLWNSTAATAIALETLDSKKDGRCTGSLHEYLRNTPPGCRSYSANQYASAESDTVRQKANWHDERVFPVPVSIDPNRQVFMESHFRLGAKKSVSPRVYVFDATRKDGKVYVGYIGRHLDNTKS